MPPPPPLTDEEKRALLRKSKLKFQAAKDEFGEEATAWHREQLKLAARDRCVYGPGAPGAPCDGGRARVRGGEDLSTWDAAAKAAQTKKPAPVPESLDMKALRAEAATGDADAHAKAKELETQAIGVDVTFDCYGTPVTVPGTVPPFGSVFCP